MKDQQAMSTLAPRWTPAKEVSTGANVTEKSVLVPQVQADIEALGNE